MSTDQAGRSPLHYAAADGDEATASQLLSDGADPNVADAARWTPMHFAAQAYARGVVQLLLDAGAEVDPVDEHGNTPLWVAVFNSQGRGEVIRRLLTAGADPEHRNHADRSPVELARLIGNFDVGQFFEAP